MSCPPAARRLATALAVPLVLAACSDPAAAPGGGGEPTLSAATLLERYVALGTSNSQGARSAGIDAAAQRAAWPARLAARAGTRFSLPLVQDPGCTPPLVPPLIANLALASAPSSTCMPLQPGVVLPTNNVAISGSNVNDALTVTPALASARNARTGVLYGRILAPGQTQVSAMLAQRPTFVSIELAANDVLPASSGRIEAMTPFASWQRDYDQVLAAVRSTGARALLVGLPNDAANFPSIRRAPELFAEATYLATLGVIVSASCRDSDTYVHIPGYLLTLLQRAPTIATCANVPGAVDYVLTPSDIGAINTRMAEINAHIRAKATEGGDAYFALSVLYDLPKPPLDARALLFSSTPFGAQISLDGVHPSAEGQELLATAAAQAIAARYGVTIQ